VQIQQPRHNVYSDSEPLLPGQGLESAGGCAGQFAQPLPRLDVLDKPALEAATLHQQRHESHSARVGRESKQRRQVKLFKTGAQHLHFLQELRLSLRAPEVKHLDGWVCPTHPAQLHCKKHAAEAAPADAVQVCEPSGGGCQLHVSVEENDH
jgi:hypothetical protein